MRNFAEVSETSENKQWVKPVTVVIAEDHEAIRILLVRQLESRGAYRVLRHVTHGAQVAAICAELKPQLLILDVELPDRSGLDVAREVAVASPDTHILIFTGFMQPSVICEALQAGVRGILEKTAGLDALEAAVSTVSLGREYYGEAVLPILPQALKMLRDAPAGGLTEREREVLGLIAEGLSSRQIAERFGISERTVGNHRANMMSKLGAHNAADLTREALRLGLVNVNRRTPTEPR
jgi:DNA-binding NarL/FixJ family response regulator